MTDKARSRQAREPSPAGRRKPGTPNPRETRMTGTRMNARRTGTPPSRRPPPDQARAIRRHLASAEGAHLLCRRGACRRARACRQDDSCHSALAGKPDAAPPDMELWCLRMSYFLRLIEHWQTLPHRRRGGRGAVP